MPLTDLKQFLRYVIVGAMNTLTTLIVILLCKSVIGINPWISNALGYIAGVINSFFWNKTWVFHSNSAIKGEAARFLIGFGLCYAIQLAVTWSFTYAIGSWEHTLPWGFVISGYGIATLIGTLTYTISNYLYNRVVTFKN